MMIIETDVVVLTKGTLTLGKMSDEEATLNVADQGPREGKENMKSRGILLTITLLILGAKPRRAALQFP